MLVATFSKSCKQAYIFDNNRNKLQMHIDTVLVNHMFVKTNLFQCNLFDQIVAVFGLKKESACYLRSKQTLSQASHVSALVYGAWKGPVWKGLLWKGFNRVSALKGNLTNTSLPHEDAQAVKPLNSDLCTRRYLITGSQRVSNYWWASVISLGGIAFLLTGFAAFLNKSLFVFNQSKSISFLPQGLIMCFYGSLGLLFGIYLWCTILWGVGNGFNEFDKKQGTIRIFRWGLPGKNRRIDLVYSIEQVEGVRVELKEGINPRRTISLRLKTTKDSRNRSSRSVRSDSTARPDTEKPTSIKDSQARAPSRKALLSASGLLDNSLSQPAQKGGTALNSNIPLTRIGQPIGLEDIESEASELARFLQVPLDSFYEM